MNKNIALLLLFLPGISQPWPCDFKDGSTIIMVVVFPIGLTYVAVKGSYCLAKHLNGKYHHYRTRKKQQNKPKNSTFNTITPGNPYDPYVSSGQLIGIK